MTSQVPFQSTFLESIEDLHFSESATQGSYSRASQMAPHIYMMELNHASWSKQLMKSDAADQLLDELAV